MANFFVIPVKTGIQDQENKIWIPASAGMTSFLTIFPYGFQSAKLIQKTEFMKNKSAPAHPF